MVQNKEAVQTSSSGQSFTDLRPSRFWLKELSQGVATTISTPFLRAVLSAFEEHKHEDVTIRFDRYEHLFFSDPFVNTAVLTYADYVLANRFSFQDSRKGFEDSRELRAIKQWANEVGYMTVGASGQGLHEVMHRMIREWMVFGNLFIEFELKVKPFNQLVFLHPRTMDVKRDRNGTLIEIRQTGAIARSENGIFPVWTVDGRGNTSISNIIFSPWNPTGKGPYGVGIIEPSYPWFLVREQLRRDFQALGNMVAMPIMHIKAGTDRFPMRGSGFTDIKNEAEKLKPGQALATRHNVQISLIEPSRNSVIIDISNIVDNNVISGLGVPKTLLGLGEGSSRASSQIQLTGFEQRIKKLQAGLQILFENIIIPKILEVKGFGKTRVIKFVWQTWGIENSAVDAANLFLLGRLSAITPNEVRRFFASRYNLLGDIEGGNKPVVIGPTQGRTPGSSGTQPEQPGEAPQPEPSIN